MKKMDNILVTGSGGVTGKAVKEFVKIIKTKISYLLTLQT